MSGPYPYARFIMPYQYAPSPTGAPLDGAKLYFFLSGTSEPLDTFADQALSQPNTNPVIADGAGIFPAIFLDPASAYKAVLTDKDGATQWAADPVSIFNPDETTSSTVVVAECTVDGNGQVPQVGICGDAYLPVGCTLSAAVAQSNVAGDVQVDVWVAPFVTNTPPTAQNSITASDPVELSSSVSSIDTALTGWTKALAANSAIRFNIVSIDTITRFTITLVGNASQ